jgi:hypothetical protein
VNWKQTDFALPRTEDTNLAEIMLFRAPQLWKGVWWINCQQLSSGEPPGRPSFPPCATNFEKSCYTNRNDDDYDSSESQTSTNGTDADEVR